MSQLSCFELSAVACDPTDQVLDVAELRGVEGGFSPVPEPSLPLPTPWCPIPPPWSSSPPLPPARS
jgi:hypothetical protein